MSYASRWSQEFIGCQGEGRGLTLSVLGELMDSCVVKRLFNLESSTLHIGMLFVLHMDHLLQLVIL